MATDVDQTTETTRVAREYFAALARGERRCSSVATTPPTGSGKSTA